MDRDSAIRKVKACLKLSQSANENEATARGLKHSINAEHPSGNRLFPFMRSSGSGTGVSK